jgi:hypothetical protein
MRTLGLPRKCSVTDWKIEGMYFNWGSGCGTEHLLLPDEFCIAEDEKGSFDLRCEKEGFRLFGRRDINLGNAKAKIYLTNFRVYKYIQLKFSRGANC